jgi:hypothetical protein
MRCFIHPKGAAFQVRMLKTALKPQPQHYTLTDMLNGFDKRHYAVIRYIADAQAIRRPACCVSRSIMKRQGDRNS